MYSVKEASRLMGISEQRVRRLLADGRIKGKKLDGYWVVLKLGYIHKRGYNPSRGGHAPGHLREAFLDYIDRLVVSDPSEHIQPYIDDKPVKIKWLIGQLWNCNDILPLTYSDDLESLDYCENCSTYAQAVRALSAILETQNEGA